MQESEDITKDHETFAKDLKNALDQKLSNVRRDETLAILEIFDVQTLIKLQYGEVSARKNHYDIPEREIEDYGICEWEQLLSVIAEIKNIEGSGSNFYHRVAHKYQSGKTRLFMQGYGNSFVLNGLYALMIVKHWNLIKDT